MAQPQMQPQNNNQPNPSYGQMSHMSKPEPKREPEPAPKPEPSLEQQQLLGDAARLMRDVESQPVEQQLSRYKKLRFEEQELRGRVHFLESQVARAGHIQTPVSLALQLKAEKTKLAQVQQELRSLISELEDMVELHWEERASIDVDELSQLIDEIKAKREQELIYQENIYYLEELQAKMGLAVRVDLFNELKWTREKLENILTELNSLKQEVIDCWDVEEPPFFSSIDTMNSEKLLDISRALTINKLRKRFPNFDEQLLYPPGTFVW
jgi:hypothetical protein